MPNEITDAMVDRAYEAYYGCASPGRFDMRRALEAALILPGVVVCKNCGKPKDVHDWPTHALGRGPRCPGTVWEPAS